MITLSIKDALNQALHQMMAADRSVVVIGEDVREGVFGVTTGLLGAYGPARVINTPISETAFTGMAIGAAMTGLKPVLELMFCDFMGVCFDQILNQAAKMRYLSAERVSLPLVIRTTMGAGDGSGAMHSQSLHGLLLQVPGLVVVCPATPADAAGLLKSALLCPDPVVFLEHKGLYDYTGTVDPSLPPVPLGTGCIVREGSDITIVAAVGMLRLCLNAAERLATDGIAAEVIDPRTIAPLDLPLVLDSVRKTGRFLVVDEGAPQGGFADSILVKVITAGIRMKQVPGKITPPNSPIPYARTLEQQWLPTEQGVITAVKQQLDQ